MAKPIERVSNRRGVKLALAVAIAVSAAFLAAWMSQPDTSIGPCSVVNGPTVLPEIPEASGLAISRSHPGTIWSHNDSGNAAVLFAVDRAGSVHGRVRLPIATRDWEDISAARCASGACLYIGDIGDNRRARQSVQIYRVPEPSPGDGTTAPADAFTATYSDGPHNAEAMFAIGDDLFIVTRDQAGDVYRASVPAAAGGALTFQRIGRLGLETVTDAEASTDETSVVVRTSHEAVLYRADELIHGRHDPYLRIPVDRLREPQGEGVALDGNVLYLASEGNRWNPGGRLLSLRCAFANGGEKH